MAAAQRSRLGAGGQQGQVAAPGPALDHAPVRVDQPGRHAVVGHRGHVGQLGQPGPALDGVPPGRAVAGRAAVVDLDDHEPGVHPGRAHRAEPVLVGRVRAAVQAEHRGRPLDARRLGAGTSACTRPPGPSTQRSLDRHRARGPLAGRGDQQPVGAVRVQRAHRAGSAADEQVYSTVPSGRTSAEPTQPGGHRQLAPAPRCPGRTGTAGCGPRVCARPAAPRRPGRSRRPARRAGPRPAPARCPRRRPRAAAPPGRAARAAAAVGVAGPRDEGERGQPAAGPVGLLGDQGAVGHPDHPHRRVPRVAVLGVADRQQRLVLGQRPHPGVLRVGVDGARRTVATAQPDACCRRRSRCRRPASSGRSPGRPGSRPARSGSTGSGAVSGRAAGERLGDPVPELVTVGVGEPVDRRPVRGQSRPSACRCAGAVTLRCWSVARSQAYTSVVPPALET